MSLLGLSKVAKRPIDTCKRPIHRRVTLSYVEQTAGQRRRQRCWKDTWGQTKSILLGPPDALILAIHIDIHLRQKFCFDKVSWNCAVLHRPIIMLMSQIWFCNILIVWI